jgi:DNA-binding transcriptional ArsR family regulator
MVFTLKKELSIRGVATVFVHHMRKDRDTYRGATTWRDLADVGLSLAASENDNTLLTLKMDRNRFGPKLMEYLLTLQTVELSDAVPSLDGQTGVYLGSSRRTSATGGVGKLWEWMVEALRTGAQLTNTRIRTDGPLAGGYFDRTLGDLREAGLIVAEKSGRSTYYTLSELGEKAAYDVGVFEEALQDAAVARRAARLEPEAPEEVEEI